MYNKFYIFTKNTMQKEEAKNLLLEDKIVLNWKFVSMRIDCDWIFICDLTDEYNEPSGFTRAKRGLKKCIEAVLEIRNGEQTKFNDISEICDKFEMKFHYYCAMD